MRTALLFLLLAGCDQPYGDSNNPSRIEVIDAPGALSKRYPGSACLVYTATNGDKSIWCYVPPPPNPPVCTAGPLK